MTSPWSRRTFLRAGAAMAAVPPALRRLSGPGGGPAITVSASAAPARRPETPGRISDPARLRALAHRALEAATAAGARYADVRFTRTITQEIRTAGAGGMVIENPTTHDVPRDREWLAVGVRALAGGAWGFAASQVWGDDEVVVLAREAATQAKANAVGGHAAVELGPPATASGEWVMPGIDPFTIPMEEKLDLFMGWGEATRVLYRNMPGPAVVHGGMSRGVGSMTFTRQERVLATSDGAYCAQTMYDTEWRFECGFDNQGAARDPWFGLSVADGVGRAGRGWDYILEAHVGDQIPRLFERAEREAHERLPVKPIDVGRYDVVMDAATAARLVDRTIGAATQLDLALGYEVNAGGSSYLDDPLAMLGTLQLGAPLLTVTANRSAAGGLATVKWDDEGVEPDTATLVKDGVLTDFQTTRAEAALLAPYYQKAGRPARSHGHAGAESALFTTAQQMPNVVLEPGRQEVSFEDMIEATPRGIAVIDGQVETDYQGRTGTVTGRMREIVNGRLGAIVGGPALLFQSNEMWKNLTAVGGPASRVWVAADYTKGQPAQTTVHSVCGVPVALKNMTLIDPRRRA